MLGTEEVMITASLKRTWLDKLCPQHDVMQTVCAGHTLRMNSLTLRDDARTECRTVNTFIHMDELGTTNDVVGWELCED